MATRKKKTRINACVQRFEILNFELELPENASRHDVLILVAQAACDGAEVGRKIIRCLPDAIEYEQNGEWVNYQPNSD